MNEYGKLDKRISFMDTDKRNADLLVRLKHDGLTKTKFFRAILGAYLEQDPVIMEFVDNLKEQTNSQSKNKVATTQKLRKTGQENKKKFGLEEDTIESIFALLEKEHPDL